MDCDKEIKRLEALCDNNNYHINTLKNKINDLEDNLKKQNIELLKELNRVQLTISRTWLNMCIVLSILLIISTIFNL